MCIRDSPCSSQPCENGGTCEGFGLEDFMCICPPGYTGDVCGELLVPKSKCLYSQPVIKEFKIFILGLYQGYFH